MSWYRERTLKELEGENIPTKSVQLPRVIMAGFSSSRESSNVHYDRSASGMLIGLRFTQTKTRYYKDGFNYTEVTSIVFKGLGGGEPVKKTVTYIYPEEGDTIPANKLYPVFSPTEIITEYKYLNPEKPVLSEYQGSTSHVIVENLGESGDVTVMVKDWSIVFHTESGEKVRVSAHLSEPLPSYSRPIVPEAIPETIEWNPPFRWEARPSISGDVTQGVISIERI